MAGNPVLLWLVFWPMGGAFLTWLAGKKNKDFRDLSALLVVITEWLVMSYFMVREYVHPEISEISWKNIFMLGIHFRLDGFRTLMAYIASLMWMMTTVFSREYLEHERNRNRYYFFTLITLGATMGVFLSADLYTTFIFFEIMSFSSYVWVVQEESKKALRASETYLAVAVIGGLVMLMGLFLLRHSAGTLDPAGLRPAVAEAILAGNLTMSRLYLIGGLLVFGFGAKAGMFPLHIWLPEAHPVAPAPASALLSGILTKTGIFGILAVTCTLFRRDPSWGFVLVIFGVLTMFTGALLAVFSVNLKRILACSSLSQIGFILIGTGLISLLGERAAFAARGTILHMVNHALIKLVLFMAAGVIFMNTGQLDLNEIRGFGRKKPLLKAAFLMGTLGISGIPFWNGYLSKTLLHESILQYSAGFGGSSGLATVGSAPLWKGIEWIFLISGGMTLAYMLKIFIAVFVEKNGDTSVQESFDRTETYWNASSRAVIICPAALLPILGMVPGLFTDHLADMGLPFLDCKASDQPFGYFTPANLGGACISVLIGLFVYFVVIRKLLMKIEMGKDPRGIYVDRWPKWINLENVVYRPVLLIILPGFFGILCRFLDSALDLLLVFLRKTVYRQTGVKGRIWLARLKTRLAITGLAEKMFTGSLSFGLFLVSVGILIVLSSLLFIIY